MRPAILLDIVAVFVFAFLARVAHGGLDIGAILGTFWPWAVGVLVGWAIILGAKVAGKWRQGTIAWLSSLIVGMIIWSLMEGRIGHISFIIVATIMSAVCIYGWRLFDRANKATRASA